MLRMGGAGRSGNGLRMVSRISLSSVCLYYVDSTDGGGGLKGLGLGYEWLTELVSRICL